MLSQLKVFWPNSVQTNSTHEGTYEQNEDDGISKVLIQLSYCTKCTLPLLKKLRQNRNLKSAGLT